MSEVSAEEAERAGQPLRFAVLSGPSFAAELALGVPTAAVIASADDGFARALQETLSTRQLRLYTSRDVAGVELAGAAKNVIAIAAGVVSGLGFGHNTLAALITRGLHEMTRLGVAYGGQPQTFSGLAGLGDLVLTCTGEASRNRRAGLALAKGEPLGRDRERDRPGRRGRAHLDRHRPPRRAQAGRDADLRADGGGDLRRQGRRASAVEELMLRELKSEAAL